MIPEIYFLRYARPCADFMAQRKEISINDLKRLDGMLSGEIAPDRAYIEKNFIGRFCLCRGFHAIIGAFLS
jgi:hypothetical protein